MRLLGKKQDSQACYVNFNNKNVVTSAKRDGVCFSSVKSIDSRVNTYLIKPIKNIPYLKNDISRYIELCNKVGANLEFEGYYTPKDTTSVPGSTKNSIGVVLPASFVKNECLVVKIPAMVSTGTRYMSFIVFRYLFFDPYINIPEKLLKISKKAPNIKPTTAFTMAHILAGGKYRQYYGCYGNGIPAILTLNTIKERLDTPGEGHFMYKVFTDLLAGDSQGDYQLSGALVGANSGQFTTKFKLNKKGIKNISTSSSIQSERITQTVFLYEKFKNSSSKKDFESMAKYLRRKNVENILNDLYKWKQSL